VPTTVAPSGYVRLLPTTNTGNHGIVGVSARSGLVRSAEPYFGADPNDVTATVDASLNTGSNNPYWNPAKLYDLYFNTILAPDGGETGL
jgi:hypothetical protein